MRNNFEPKHLHRAKETLKRQLHIVEDLKTSGSTPSDEKKRHQMPCSFVQQIKTFLKRFISF